MRRDQVALTALRTSRKLASGNSPAVDETVPEAPVTEAPRLDGIAPVGVAPVSESTTKRALSDDSSPSLRLTMTVGSVAFTRSDSA